MQESAALTARSVIVRIEVISNRRFYFAQTKLPASSVFPVPLYRATSG